MKKLIRYFLQGLLYIVPIAVTVYIIAVAIIWTDGLLMDREFFQKGILAKYNFPGLGLVTILILITMIGFIGQKLISSPFSEAYNKLIKKAPLIKIIYTSVKDLMSAFVGGEKKFNTPVLVQMDEHGTLNRLGFITSNSLEDFGIDEMVGVYFPSSYGMLGELYLVPKKNVKNIDANSADVMKYIVSGGVSKIKN
ncbi:DUF502 domain-containing protein [Plebeiibacterium marinum]|uniref:DUF502 domain-containing protein n=1 Tax=Plebeiibacterium marinum TaxID=2992111 RepID=A0AAE3MEQ8_9BACT|nr:DUF502 domain-containing protein [Plebeiobacterium marinum]MCW3806101.1 DUF502 domain-containing protein [Plebeiobacterium marinum]